MPFIEDSEFSILSTDLSKIAPVGETKDGPSLSDTFGAAFRQENIIGSMVSTDGDAIHSGFDLDQYDPEFNPNDHIEGYELFAEEFAYTNDVEQVEAVKRQIDKEQADREMLSNAGVMGMVATFAAGATSPINLIPVGGSAIHTYKAGQSILKGAAQTGLVAAGAMSVEEALLHGQQVSRTLGESAINIGAATFLGGLLGAGSKALSARGFNNLAKAVEADTVYKELEPNSINVGDAGAAKVHMNTKLKKGFGLEKWDKSSPLIRTMQSDMEDVRDTALRLAETPYRTDGMQRAAVETRAKMWEANLYKGLVEMDTQYKAYKKAGGKMKHHQFRELVGRTMRRGDVSDIPQVSATARSFRSVLYDPLKDKAIQIGALPEDIAPETAVSYLNRVYSREKIARDYDGFHSAIVRHLEKDLKGELEPGEISRIASDVIATIRGDAFTTLDPNVKLAYFKVKGPLAERTLKMLDEELEPWLEHDIEFLSKVYTRRMGTQVEMIEEFGDVDMRSQIGKIEDAYINQMKADPGNVKKLGSRMKKDIRDIEGMRDRILGRYDIGEPESTLRRVGRGVRTYQYVRLLGGMTLSAIPDTARHVMMHGFIRTFNDGLVPLVRNLKNIRLAASEAKAAGTALDVVLNTRMNALAELGDDAIRGGRGARIMETQANFFGRATGMAYWNAAQKQFAGMMTMNRSLKAISSMANGKISKADKRWLEWLGVDEDVARAIRKQFKKHGKIESGFYYANTGAWDDVGATTAMRALMH